MCPRQGMAESQTLIKVIAGVLQVPQNTAERAHHSCFCCTRFPSTCLLLICSAPFGAGLLLNGSLTRDTQPLLVRTHGQALPTHCCGVSTTHSTSIHSVAKQEPPAHAWGILKLLQHPRITPGPQNCPCAAARSSVSLTVPALCRALLSLWQVTHGHSGLPRSPACPHPGMGAQTNYRILHVPPVGFCHT